MDLRNIEIEPNEPSHIHVPRPSRLNAEPAPHLETPDFTEFCGELFQVGHGETDSTAA